MRSHKFLRARSQYNASSLDRCWIPSSLPEEAGGCIKTAHSTSRACSAFTNAAVVLVLYRKIDSLENADRREIALPFQSVQVLELRYTTASCSTKPNGSGLPSLKLYPLEQPQRLAIFQRSIHPPIVLLALGYILVGLRYGIVRNRVVGDPPTMYIRSAVHTI